MLTSSFSNCNTILELTLQYEVVDSVVSAVSTVSNTKSGILHDVNEFGGRLRDTSLTANLI